MDAKRRIVIFNRVGTTVDSVAGQRVGRISRRRNPPLRLKQDGGLRCANLPYELL